MAYTIVDSVISRLLEARSMRPGKPIQLSESEIRTVCIRSREIFLSQPMLLELEAPMKICGDIHGQYFDLLRLFDFGGFPPDSNYLFLGNYVDYGMQSLETMCLLLAYKIKYPENFFLLRGNHECASINRSDGFYDECKRRYDIKLWKTFTDCFNCLPVAAIIDEKIFCCHGGLSPDLQSMEQIRRIMRPTDVPDQGLLCDLLWSDPDREISGWGVNDRGVSFTFGPEIVTKFLLKHDFDLICRSHQVVEDGYEFFAKRQLVTLFSAPNHIYQGEYDNAGAMMTVDETCMCSFQILKPSDKKNFGLGLLKQSTSLHSTAPGGTLEQQSSSLHSAAWSGTLDTVKMLVDMSNLAVNAQTKEGWSPLHSAARRPSIDILKFLINRNADVFLQTEDGCLAFHLACGVGSKDCCEALLEATDEERQHLMVIAKANNGWTPLFHAVNGLNGGHLEIVQWLVDKWAVPVDDRDYTDSTPLHIASKLGFAPIAKYLVDHSALVNSRTKDGDTALHWTALYNKKDVADLLIQKGANLNAQNEAKDTPIHVAKIKGYKDMYEKIKAAGADLSIRNADGLTPLAVTSEIPHEIRSRGAAAIRHFRAALQYGKTKPHRVKLMLLGDARVGKSSLYRYLTGQAFIEDLASTDGIDTRLISTPEVYPVSETKWMVEDKPQSDFKDKIARETVIRLRQDESATSDSQSRPLIEELPPRAEAAGREDHHKSTTQQSSHFGLQTLEQLHVFPPASDSPGRQTQDAEELQPDLTELPMEEIQKHWEMRTKEDKAIKFSVWDFAGQPLYEPMHHTFLTRRALYLIVLNLAKLTEKGITESDLQRIHSWVASVHTHTPLNPEPVRIFFIGTHKDSSKKDHVKIAVQQLCNCFQRSKVFACHIEYIEGDKILAQVENSSPDYEDKDVCVLRNAILKAALDRSYMKEEIPLAWLRYEDEIVSYHQLPLHKEGTLDSRCLRTVQEMQALAVKCNVNVDQDPFRTMITFFHDVGLIVYPAAMQGLDADMLKSLEDVVVPNPQWLVDLMTILVNIPKPGEQDPTYCSDWLTLKEEGILTHRLMYHIMHEKQGFIKKDVDMLSILFQALGFICRLLLRPQLMTTDEDKDEPEGSTYLVPCQLPDEKPDVDELHDKWNEEFFFDFPGFLPSLLFQHLIVRLVAHMQQQQDLIHSLESGHLRLLSKKTCLMAKDSSVHFSIKVLANRIVVRHQLSDPSAQNLLMQWLFEMVADISKLKFTNLTFACGRLCPYISCLKQAVRKESCVDAKCEFRVFDSPGCKELRSGGLPAVKCLHNLRLTASQQSQDKLMTSLITSIDVLLLIARNKGHIEKMFSYSCGHLNHHDVVPCLYSDPSEVASQPRVNFREFLIQQSNQSQQAAVNLTGLPGLLPAAILHHETVCPSLEPQMTVEGGNSGTCLSLVQTDKQAGFPPLPATKADQKVESAQLVFVAQEIAGVWEGLAAWLSPDLFSTVKMKEIERDHRGAFCQALAMLEMWRKSVGVKLLVNC